MPTTLIDTMNFVSIPNWETEVLINIQTHIDLSMEGSCHPVLISEIQDVGQCI